MEDGHLLIVLVVDGAVVIRMLCVVMIKKKTRAGWAGIVCKSCLTPINYHSVSLVSKPSIICSILETLIHPWGLALP